MAGKDYENNIHPKHHWEEAWFWWTLGGAILIIITIILAVLVYRSSGEWRWWVVFLILLGALFIAWGGYKHYELKKTPVVNSKIHTS